MKKNFKKLFMFIVIVQIAFLMSILIHAGTIDEKNESVNTDLINCDITNGTTIKQLDLNLNAEKTNINQPIKITFDKNEGASYYFEADGVEVFNANNDATEIEVIAKDKFGTLSVFADYGDGNVVTGTVYTYKYNDVVFVSDLGKDIALQRCMEELYNSGKITKDEWENEYYELCQEFIKESPAQNIKNNIETRSFNEINVSGTLSWENADSNLLPLRFTKVELRQKLDVSSVGLASGMTDNNGHFSFTVPDVISEIDLFVRVYASSTTIKIFKTVNVDEIENIDDITDIFPLRYYIDFPIRENISAGTTIGYDYYTEIEKGIVVEEAIYVLQGMITGQEFASEMGMDTEETLFVLYPGIFKGVGDHAVCYGFTVEDAEYYLENYDIKMNEVLIIGLKIAELLGVEPTVYISEIGENRYNKFDTLIHEYGHFVQLIMDIYGSNLEEIMVNDPSHDWYKDNFAEKPTKEYAMKLTWSESWADVFSQLAQEYYIDEYTEVPDFGDRKHGSLDVETPTINSNSCEAQEWAVVALLWDLFDNSGATESHDNISSTYQQWWNYTTKAGTYTLSTFVDVVYTYYPNIMESVGEIMAAHQISPGDFRVLNSTNVEYNNISPRLIWTINGSQNHPNNMFDIVFYDDYGNELLYISQFSVEKAYNDIYDYRIPNDVWQEFLSTHYGSYNLNVVVRSYHSDTPVSGPYPSKSYPITIVNNCDLTIAASNRLTEHTVKLDGGKHCDFNVTFETGGVKLIQTFGTKDTVIEIYSSDGTLLKGRTDTDDKGYSANALIAYEMAANVQYKIRVKFYGTTAYGETKLAIMMCNSDLSGTSVLTQYEDITNVSNSAGFSYNTFLEERGYVAAVTYKPTVSGNYKFEIQSNYDTYIYVIDPRSNQKLVVNVDFNDDSGEGLNPLLIKHLDANVSYLIVYSMYNPNTVDTRKDLVLSVSREAT